MKKICFILSIAILLHLPFKCVWASNSSDDFSVDSFGVEQTELMVQLGIYDEDVNSYDAVTRAQAAKYIISLYGIDTDTPVYNTQMTFPDVTDGNEYARYINAAALNGIITGEDGFYYPNRLIRPSEFVKMLIDILGYTLNATQRGGYPYGYNAEAIRLGLLKNVDLSAASLTHGQLADIIERSFNVKLTAAKSILKSGDSVFVTIGEGSTILNSYMNIYRISGTVNSIGKCGFSDFRGKGGTIYVGNTEIQATDLVDYSLLGITVDAYAVEENDTLVLLAVKQKIDSCRELVINYDELGSNAYNSTNNSLTYYKDNKTYVAKLDNNLEVIYNGGYISSYNASDFCPAYGNVRLIDTNNNGVYDRAVILSWDISHISKILPYERMLLLDDGTTLDVSEYEENVIILKDGKLSDIRNYSSQSVLLKAISKDGKSIILDICGNSITGMVSQSSDNEVVIDDKVYKTLLNIPVGEKGEYYVDDNNTIIYNIKGDDTAYHYGYVVDVAESEGLENARIRILTEKEGIKIYFLRKNISFNGQSSNSADIVQLYSSKRQLIKYRLNKNGEITAIQTPQDMTGSGKGYNDKHFSMDYKNTAIQYNLISGGKYQYTFSKYYLGDNSTIIMRVPKYNNPEDVEFRVVSKGDFSGLSSKYNIEIYDADEWFVPKLVIVYSTHPYYSHETSDVINNSISLGSKTGIVVSKSKVLIGNEAADCVNLLVDGSLTSRYFLSTRSFTWDSVMSMYKQNVTDSDGAYLPSYSCPHADGMYRIERDMQVGDIIQYTSDSKALFTGLRVLYKNTDQDPNSPDTLFSQKHYKNSNDDGIDNSNDRNITFDYNYWFNGLNASVGEAVVTNIDRVVFKLGTGYYRNIYMSLSKTTISNCMIYDSETKKMIKATPLDIKKNDKVVVISYNGSIDTSVILR